jgi:transposase
MTSLNIYPEWALKLKTHGTAIHKIKNNYYLYKISSVYDSEKKRARKKTDEYIGRITETDGLIAKKARIRKSEPFISHNKKEEEKENTKKSTLKDKDTYKKIDPDSKVYTKEYGAASFVNSISTDILEQLKKFFPLNYEEIFCAAYHRLTQQSRLKNMQMLQEQSYMSEIFPKVNLSKNGLTTLLQNLGSDRETVVSFMKQFIEGSDYLSFDVTDVISQSRSTKMAAKGYNSHSNFDPQVNLFYLYANDKKSPVYYRVFPGNISGMQAMKISIEEAGIQNAMMVGDKGFCSKNNLYEISKNKLNFILPLRRDSSYIDYSTLTNGRYSEAFAGRFAYQKRPIFYYELSSTELLRAEILPEELPYDKAIIYGKVLFYMGQTLQIKNNKILQAIFEKPYLFNIDDNAIREHIASLISVIGLKFNSFDSSKKVVIYKDIRLEYEELASYDERVRESVDGYTEDGFQKKELTFGTIALITNMLDSSAKVLYENYKNRNEIEIAFDAYKNLLEADRTYMQSDISINGWCFINHLSLLMYYKILNIIKDKEESTSITPKDLLLGLCRVNKINLNGEWRLSEINSRFKKNISKLEIHIT